MNQLTQIRADAGKEITIKIHKAWDMIFKYENFFGNTNRRSELNDRLDMLRYIVLSYWPTYTINTSSFAVSGAMWNPLHQPPMASMSPMASISPITSYCDIFDEPPWYKRWYKSCKKAALVAWVFIRIDKWLYKGK